MPQVFVALVAASGGLLFGYDLGVQSCSQPITSSVPASIACAQQKHQAEPGRTKLQLLAFKPHYLHHS